jgi:hypothetical protein
LLLWVEEEDWEEVLVEGLVEVRVLVEAVEGLEVLGLVFRVADGASSLCPTD